MRIALLPILFALAACGGRMIDAPSLSPRAVEKSPVPYPDQASEPQVAADPALIEKIAAIEADAAKGHAAFEAAQARAAAAIAKAAGAAAGSEAWTVAQQELSVLESARNVVGHAGVDLDGLRNDPANATSGNRTAIDAASVRVEALSKAEADAVSRLSAGLSE